VLLRQNAGFQDQRQVAEGRQVAVDQGNMPDTIKTNWLFRLKK
jgi:hypothetical protein